VVVVELVVGCGVVVDVAGVVFDADVSFIEVLVVLFVKVVFTAAMNEVVPEPDDLFGSVPDAAEARFRM
jgi:hypothetical protein